MYKGGTFKFTVAISNNYPHEPPKVKCLPKVRCSVRADIREWGHWRIGD